MMKNDRSRWMLYGAYGTTGRLILEEALRLGRRPLLAGRDPSRLSALASATGLDAVVLPLDAPETAKRALDGVSVLLNAAGPYFETGPPLRSRCLEAGTSYLDVNGEIGDFLQAMDRDAEARATRIAIIPGAGFGVVFGEALGVHMARRLPDASWLRMSFDIVNESTSRGASRSTASALSGGGYVVSDGVLSKRPTASSSWRVPQSRALGRPLRFAAAPRAELIAAHRTTGIKDIVVGVPLSLGAAMALRVAGPLIGRILLRTSAADRTEPSSAKTGTASPRSRIWAEAGNQAGRRVMSVLETGEGYRLAASAAAHAVEQLLTVHPSGSLTPAAAFGVKFALSLPETRIIDLEGA